MRLPKMNLIGNRFAKGVRPPPPRRRTLLRAAVVRVGMAGTAASLAIPAAWAAPMDGAATSPALITAVLAAAAALVLAGLLYRAHRRLGDRDARTAALTQALTRARAIADTAPPHLVLDGRIGQPTEADGSAGRDGKDDPLARFLATLDEDGAARLRAAVATLRRTGVGFTLSAGTADGQGEWQVRADTRAMGEEGAVLWLSDTSAAADQRQALTDRETAAEQAAALLDLVPVPIWLRHADLSLAWCNSAYRRAVEAPVDATPGDGPPTAEIAAGALDDDGRALARRVRDSGRTESAEHYVVVQGQRRCLGLTEAALPGLAALPGAIGGYALDRTEVQVVRSERDRHIEAHNEVLHRMRTAIAIFGADKHLDFYNQAYAQLWGLEERWLDDKPSFTEILEDLRTHRRLPEYADFRAFRDERLALFTSVIELEEELEYLPDGRIIRSVISPHPFGGLMWVIEDVTSALTLEANYKTMIAVQRESLDNLAEGIAVFGSDGRLRLSNPEYARLWDIEEDALADAPHITKLAQSMHGQFADGQDWEEVRAALSVEAMEQHIQRGRLNRQDGLVLDYSTVRLPDGGVLLSFLNVTDNVRVERALRASNEALEEADKLKSLFIANVSYQLRTPLQAIVGFAELLEKQIAGPLNAQQQDYAHSLMDAANLLVKLINDMLDLATIEAGQLTLTRRAVDVRIMLQAVADLARNWADAEGLAIEVQCQETVGAVSGDERRLKQALFNLIGNAIKFTPPGGRITLAADRGRDTLNLLVHDTGIGIPADAHERVFNRFEKAHQNLRQSGAGLGLSLVKKLIELHGGHVELDSEVGQGTTVICTLPLDDTGAQVIDVPDDPADADNRPPPSADEPLPPAEDAA